MRVFSPRGERETSLVSSTNQRQNADSPLRRRRCVRRASFDDCGHATLRCTRGNLPPVMKHQIIILSCPETSVRPSVRRSPSSHRTIVLDRTRSIIESLGERDERRVPSPSTETLLRPPTFCLRASLKLDREFDHAGSRGRLRQRLVLRRSQLIRDWVEGGGSRREFEQEMEKEVEEEVAAEGTGGGEGGGG